MGYCLDRSDRNLEAGLRRIALDQIDRGLEESLDDELSMAERIHQIRKRCKKLRGLVRLVRPAFDAYSAENAAFRDAARRLSDVRDAAALVETCDAVTARFADRLADDAFAELRADLARDARRLEGAGDVADRLEAMRADLRAARERAAGWSLRADDAATLAAGVGRTFGRARKAMKTARKDPGAGTFHEWRKRVKYHWYHMRLLKRTAPMLDAQADIADALADDLGDHHDTHVMEAALEGRAAADAAEALRGLLIARRRVLEARALRSGTMLFEETAKGQSRRVAGYWNAWREDVA